MRWSVSSLILSALVAAGCTAKVFEYGGPLADADPLAPDADTTPDAEPPADVPTIPVCGDGFITPPEICDDDNAMTETACPYGMPTCTACNGTCDMVIGLTGPYCLDGTVNGPEACDDGAETGNCDGDCTLRVCGDGHVNMISEECDPGGTATCDGDCSLPVCGDGFHNPLAGEECDTAGDSNMCDSDCTLRTCGDGYLNPTAEVCDDGNAMPCGVCNSTCTTLVPLQPAMGDLNHGSSGDFSDGQTLTLNDGINPPTVFEFDTIGNGVAGGNVMIFAVGGGTCQMRDMIRGAIDGVGPELLIMTSGGGCGNIALLHDLAGGFGNQPITTTCPPFALDVMGMMGGSGADCPPGTGCTEPDVCLPVDACTGGVCM